MHIYSFGKETLTLLLNISNYSTISVANTIKYGRWRFFFGSLAFYCFSLQEQE